MAVVALRGRQSQCPICDRVFSSDAMCEKHKRYREEGSKRGNEFAKARCVDPSGIGMVEGDRGWTIPVAEDAKWWGEPVERVPAGPQELVCVECKKEWSRPAQRGRKPNLCPECKSAIGA